MAGGCEGGRQAGLDWTRRVIRRAGPLVAAALAVLASCDPDPTCALPGAPTTLYRQDQAVLLLWEGPDRDVFDEPVLPDDPAFLAYRARMREDGADLPWPVADAPVPGSEDQARIWSDEDHNNDLVRRGEVGSIAPITCLDALLFAYQNRRFSQIEAPTEFLASVLTREVDGEARIAIVFGAGREMFPPKTVYGFDRVRELVAEGWRWRYALHNHTIQHNGDRLALGAPSLSTSDVDLTRGLARDSGLESARVTNGFYTFIVAAPELERLRGRR